MPSKWAEALKGVQDAVSHLAVMNGANVKCRSSMLNPPRSLLGSTMAVRAMTHKLSFSSRGTQVNTIRRSRKP